MKLLCFPFNIHRQINQILNILRIFIFYFYQTIFNAYQIDILLYSKHNIPNLAYRCHIYFNFQSKLTIWH